MSSCSFPSVPVMCSVPTFVLTNFGVQYVILIFVFTPGEGPHDLECVTRNHLAHEPTDSGPKAQTAKGTLFVLVTHPTPTDLSELRNSPARLRPEHWSTTDGRSAWSRGRPVTIPSCVIDVGIDNAGHCSPSDSTSLLVPI